MGLIIAAFTLGLAGSLHCSAMCGPLLISLSMGDKGKANYLKSTIIHHSGRIFAYAIMGTFMGVLGSVFSIGGFQQKLSLVAGVFLLLTLFVSLKCKNESGLTSWIKRKWAQFIQERNIKKRFFLGALNGLLPCGLVYTALAAAAVAGSWYEGGLFMMVFGIGTFPLLAGFTWSGLKASGAFQKFKNFILPTATCLTAAILILRGMDLGIPYISPEINADNTPSCCQQKD